MPSTKKRQHKLSLDYLPNMYIGSRSISGNSEIAGSSHLLHITQNTQMKGKNKMKNADSI